MTQPSHDTPEGLEDRAACVVRVKRCLDVIERHNEELRALITIDTRRTLNEAASLDRDRARGVRLGPAAGLIVVLKDNIDTAGLKTTIGSSFFAERIPAEDACVTRRLRAERALILGKANMHEFAFGATSQNPHHGAVRNPWDVARIPGGSSGGSAVSVAAGMCEASLGTDTGGSVRIPAALNGIVGLRPTIGRVSNSGSMPSSPRLDTIGPLARTAKVTATLYEAVAGFNPRDPSSVDQPLERVADLKGSPLRAADIGLPKTDFFDDADPDVVQVVFDAVNVLRELGARFVPLAVENARSTHDAVACVVRADAANVHRELLESKPDGFGADVLTRLQLGLKTSREEYAAGMNRWNRWRQHVARLFEHVDFILTPTVGFAAPLISSLKPMYLQTHGLTAMTFVWSFSNSPAISIPCGFTREGLPVGMQLIGRPWTEARLLAAAIGYQEVTSHHLRHPASARDHGRSRPS